jgi:hypothetical protein
MPKLWNQSRGPTTDDWITKKKNTYIHIHTHTHTHTHTGVLVIKKIEIMSFAGR